MVFNGEIYNHRELGQELESRGHRFRSRCDTEVLLEAFLEWDTRCFAKLRGMFTVAIWSEPNKRLVLTRDRMGIFRIHRSDASRVGPYAIGGLLLPVRLAVRARWSED